MKFHGYNVYKENGFIKIDGRVVVEYHFPGEVYPTFALVPVPDETYRGREVAERGHHAKHILDVVEGIEQGSFIN